MFSSRLHTYKMAGRKKEGCVVSWWLFTVDVLHDVRFTISDAVSRLSISDKVHDGVVLNVVVRQRVDSLPAIQRPCLAILVLQRQHALRQSAGVPDWHTRTNKQQRRRVETARRSLSVDKVQLSEVN